MSAIIDFYAILDIEPDADADTIKGAVRRERRTWSKRQSGQDLNRRQTAERRMEALAQAEKTLLDPAARQKFDEQRRTQTPSSASSALELDSQNGTDADWMQRAREYIATGSLGNANFCAREALRSSGSNSEAWSIRAHSAMGLGDWREAEFSFTEAIRLQPDSAGFHFDLGCAYESLGNNEAALQSFADAHRLDPAEPVYEIATAGIYINSLDDELVERAVQIMEQLAKVHPDNELVKEYYAAALTERPFAYATVTGDGTTFVLTSAEQVARLKSDMERAAALDAPDEATQEGIRQRRDAADEALTIRWLHPDGGLRIAWIIAFVVCLGIAGGLFFIGIPLLALAIYGYVKLHRIPQWKAQKRIRAANPQTVVRWGI